MQINRNLSLQLKRVATIKNREARVAEFRALCADVPPIATLTQWAYHPDVKFFDFNLDEVDSLKTKEKDVTAEDSPAYKAIRSLKYLCVNSSPDVAAEKRLMIFLQMLVSTKADDSEVLKSVVLERKLPFKTLGKEFAVEAIPEMFPKETAEA